MSGWDTLDTEAKRIAFETYEAMEVHQAAHAMWGTPVAVNGAHDCPACGLTWIDMFRAVRDGRYVCAFSRRDVRPEPVA